MLGAGGCLLLALYIPTFLSVLRIADYDIFHFAGDFLEKWFLLAVASGLVIPWILNIFKTAIHILRERVR